MAAIGRLLVRVGAFDEAGDVFVAILSEQPGRLDIKIELAHLHFRMRQYKEAERFVEEVLSSEPGSVSAITLLGDIRMFQSRHDDAARLYARAQDVQPLPELAIRRFRAVSAAGKPDVALAELEVAGQKHKEAPALTRFLAEKLYFAGRLDDARRHYERLIALDPDDALAYNNLAAILEETDSEKALKAALRAYELAPSDANVLDTLGWIRVQIGELEKGLQHLREAVARNSRSAVIRYHMGVALFEYGKRDEAVRELRKALSLDPRFVHAADARERLQVLQLQ